MLAKNLAFLLGAADRVSQEAIAKGAGTTQPTISKWAALGTRKPEFRSMALLAKHLGVSLDDLAWRDLERDGPSRPSHPAKLDLRRLGVALTAIDKALSDVEIQGKLGKLDDAVQFGYAEAFELTDPDDPAARKWLDKLVAERLRDWGEREREAGNTSQGEIEDRRPAAARKTTRRR